MKTKNVQIPETLFKDLIDYHINDNPDPGLRERIVLQLNAKLSAIIAREQWQEKHLKGK